MIMITPPPRPQVERSLRRRGKHFDGRPFSLDVDSLHPSM